MRCPPFVPSVLALAVGVAAQRVVEVEPNDTVASAQTLVPGNHVSASLLAGEVDWFTFTLTAEAVVNVTTADNIAGGVDTVVSLFDSTGTTRHAHDDGAASSWCGVTLPAGTYAFEVRGVVATTAGNYALDLIAKAGGTPNAFEAVEPNQTILTASPFTMGDLISGNLSAPTDIDLHSFTLADRANVQFDVSDDSTSPQLDDTNLGLYMESPFAPGTLVLIGVEANISRSHRATLTSLPDGPTLGGVLAAGTYYLRVSTPNPAVTGIPAYNGFGNYTIRTVLMSMPSTPTTVEGPEPNNTAATATPLALGTPARGNITAGDTDWYSFTITEPTIITLVTIDGTAPAITNTTIRLRTPTSMTAFVTASTGGFASHGRIHPNELRDAGTYLIDVGGGTTSVTGNYVLLVGAAPLFSIRAFHTTTLGLGCTGSNLLAPFLTPEMDDKPVLGSTFVMRVSDLLPFAGLVTMVGLTDLTANGGAVPLPFDLASVGAPGCFLRVDPLITNFGMADATGVFLWTTFLPSSPSLRALRLHQQVGTFDAAANVLGLTTSNPGLIFTGERYQ